MFSKYYSGIRRFLKRWKKDIATIQSSKIEFSTLASEINTEIRLPNILYNAIIFTTFFNYWPETIDIINIKRVGSKKF